MRVAGVSAKDAAVVDEAGIGDIARHAARIGQGCRRRIPYVASDDAGELVVGPTVKVAVPDVMTLLSLSS